jgi:serine/threonine-protein phosphatase 2B catalytic subunit
MDIQQFTYTAHPYILPNFMNTFQWAMPFIIKKITEMMYSLLAPDKRYP